MRLGSVRVFPCCLKCSGNHWKWMLIVRRAIDATNRNLLRGLQVNTQKKQQQQRPQQHPAPSEIESENFYLRTQSILATWASRESKKLYKIKVHKHMQHFDVCTYIFAIHNRLVSITNRQHIGLVKTFAHTITKRDVCNDDDDEGMTSRGEQAKQPPAIATAKKKAEKYIYCLHFSNNFSIIK